MFLLKKLPGVLKLHPFIHRYISGILPHVLKRINEQLLLASDVQKW